MFFAMSVSGGLPLLNRKHCSGRSNAFYKNTIFFRGFWAKIDNFAPVARGYDCGYLGKISKLFYKNLSIKVL